MRSVQRGMQLGKSITTLRQGVKHAYFLKPQRIQRNTDSSVTSIDNGVTVVVLQSLETEGDLAKVAGMRTPSF